MLEESLSSPLLRYEVPLVRKSASSSAGASRRKHGLHVKERYQQTDPTFLHQGHLKHDFWSMGVRKDIHTLLVPSVDVLRYFGSSAAVISQIQDYSRGSHFVVYIESIIKIAVALMNVAERRKLEDTLVHSNASAGCAIYYNELQKDLVNLDVDLVKTSSSSSSPTLSISAYTNTLINNALLYLRIKNVAKNVVVVVADSERDIMCGSPCDKVTLKDALASTDAGKDVMKLYESLYEYYQQQDNQIKDRQSGASKFIYQPHLSERDVAAGLKLGVLTIGKLEVAAFDSSIAKVKLSDNSEILIQNILDRNRALHNDIVAVRLHPKSQWAKAPPGAVSLTRQGLRHLETQNHEDDVNDNDDDDDDDDKMYSIVLKSKRDNNAVEKGNNHENRYPTGIVVSVRKRVTIEIIASIPNQSKTYTNPSRNEHILAIPVDKKIPKIRIRTSNRQKLEGKRIVITLDSWPADSFYPIGHFTRIVGDATDWKTEVECILLRNGILKRPFTPEAMACLPSTNSLEPVLLGRVDLRKARRIFSVDPPGCVDIDDAMGVHWIQDGLLELSVHIADVCAFLEIDSALDREAQQRATSVYLPHERIDMLPSKISANMASLLGRKDRYALSVVWLVEVKRKNGTPVRQTEDLLKLQEKNDLMIFEGHAHTKEPSWAGRTVIHSDAAMTYRQAHNLIHGLPPGPQVAPKTSYEAGQFVDKSLWEDLAADLKILLAISRCLLQQRHQNGSIDFSSGGGNELKFNLDVEGMPVETIDKEKLEVHSTIEELMILANSSVCSLVRKYAPRSTLMRIHPPPSQEKLSNFEEFSANVGMKNLVEKSKSDTTQSTASNLSQEMSKFAQKDKNVVKLMTSELIKSMTWARYVSSSQLAGSLTKDSQSSQVLLRGHSGLGIDDYTHFTSPIRRYADIIVHRQLLSLAPRPTKGLPEPYSVISEASAMSSVPDSPSPLRMQPVQALRLQTGTQQIKDTPSVLVDMDDELDLLLDEGDDTISGGIDLLSSSSQLADTSSGITAPENTDCIDDTFLDELLDESLSLSKVDEAPSTTVVPSVNIMAESATVVPDHITHEQPLMEAPYSSNALERIASHLNSQNLAAKHAQMECQSLFLSLYFRNKCQVYSAVIYAIKNNGFLVYVPNLDFKGPCYLQSNDGDLCMDPALIGLYSKEEVEKYTKPCPPAFQSSLVGSALESFRCLRGYECSLEYDGSDEATPYRLDIVNVSSQKSTPVLVFKVLDTILVEVSSAINNASGLSAENPINIYFLKKDKGGLHNEESIGRVGNRVDGIINQITSELQINSSTSYPSETLLPSEATSTTPEWASFLDMCSLKYWHHALASMQLQYPTSATNSSLMTVRGKCKEKMIKSKRRVDVSGSHGGRIVFGTDDQRSALTAAGPALQKGVESARAKMAAWGEEWAEEEELPTMFESDSNANLSQKSLSQIQRLAESRINKLKIEKRNTKYKGTL